MLPTKQPQISWHSRVSPLELLPIQSPSILHSLILDIWYTCQDVSQSCEDQTILL
jgi:hypothetical protein